MKHGSDWRNNREQKRCVSFLRDLGTETTKRETERELKRDTKMQQKRMAGRREVRRRKGAVVAWRGTLERSLRKFAEGCCPLLSVV